MSVSDAHLAYGTTPALNGLNLQLREGEILGLLGPNGAGKSSLIRCVGRRQRLDRGEIRFAGSATDCPVGIVPQDIALYRDLSVLQNLRAFARLHSVAGRDLRGRVDAALAWSGLGDKRHKLVGTLSGGMQRRLNIACSVLHRPSILLLDEPTVGVDPQSRERIYEMLQDLLEGNTSILLTTHHLDEAESRCDRIAIIDKGYIVDSGTFDDLVERTVGNQQLVSIRFQEPAGEVPKPLVLSESRLEAWGQIEDVGRDLPQLLSRIGTHSASVESVSLQRPTLQSVFLHLTGRDLRE